ncbi:MAG TPA: tetratricopeptide repeat-containing glycosyltransferase family protein [Dongiaceae bacterium]|nr:tetratricopeptide repeat-containing glycosyltransferase family protein [Dongiaceae bacterium]
MDMEETGARLDASPPRKADDALAAVRALERAGRLGAAAARCRALLQDDPGNGAAWFLLSGVEQRRKRPAAALEAIERAVECDAGSAPAWCRRGSILRSLQRLEEAAESQRRAIAVDPDYAEAHSNLGNCLYDLGRWAAAAEHYQRAVAINPGYVQAHNNLGVALGKLDQDVAALASFHRALVLKPDYAGAMLNLGEALLKQNQLAEAEAALRRAAALAPDSGEAHLQLAAALLRMERADAAEPSLQRAIALVPGHAEAEFDLALLLLSQGRFAEGWKHYEARWRLRENANNPTARQMRRSVTPWAGEPLDGKAILIQDEQGLGDTIQFCRYVPLLAERGAKVTFLATRSLVRLLSPIAAVAEVAARVEVDRPFDYRAALLGLPRIFGTGLDSVPRTEGPYLRAEPDRVDAWRARIGTGGFRIAVCWQGNPNVRVDRGRSIPLGAFAPLASLPGVRLISVQKRYGLEQLDHLPSGMRVETLGPDFDQGRDAFLDTAAVMASCDLVVTSDTSVAHLAGALDRPTWLGLSTTADWRWLRQRRDSPWYRSMTLFRQREAGDWSTVFAEMADSLGGILGAKA